MSEQGPARGDRDGADDGRGAGDQGWIRTKEQAQLELIAEEFRDAVEIDPPNWREAGARCIYRAGSFLVRDRDLDRVRKIFSEGITDFDDGVGAISGLTRFQPADDFSFPDDAPEGDTLTLRYIALADRVLGRGVAVPDYLVYVTGGVSPCPASEPMEVPPGSTPVPAPVAGECDGEGVKVLVVDVGWTDPDKPWLTGVTGERERVFDHNGDIIPYAGHGTFIAGVLRCMAPRAEVVVKGYLNRAGAEFGSDLVVKLYQALAEYPDLISLSAGTKTRHGEQLLAFEVFLEHLDRVKGVVLVAAAGNDGAREYFFPAASPQTVSVGALSEDHAHRAGFSNHGGWVDVYAPGENIVNAYLTGEYVCTEPPYRGDRRKFAGMARWSGTSFATPLVAGLIAGRMSVTGENARQAADGLLAAALERPLPGVGRALLPGDACRSIEQCDCKSRCCSREHRC